MSDRSGKYCIVGSGPSGLAAAKNFQQLGIPYDCLERETDIGGLWNPASSTSTTYSTTTMVSSKRLSRFTDFPIPKAYPAYLSRLDAFAYLQSYADTFALRDSISLRTHVTNIAPWGDCWEVQIEGEETPRRYKGVVVATGHHSTPNWPEYEGEFTGEVLHSADYRAPDQLKGKRVLVVGGGISGCEIAGDGAGSARKISHSLRRGYYVLPKFIFGRPSDVIIEHTEKWPIPRAWRIRFYEAVLSLIVGTQERYGLPTPEHKLFETHPLVDSNYLTHVAHNRIAIKPDVAHADGPWIHFNDGSREEIDLIVCATGYETRFPFMDEALLIEKDGSCDLFLNIFHPEHDELFAMTLLQTGGGYWQLADYQAQLIAKVIQSSQTAPKRHAWFRRQVKRRNERSYRLVFEGASPRHALEIDFFKYRKMLRNYIRRFRS